nr:hypothetical protein [Tanacetum cinerariifolium]
MAWVPKRNLFLLFHVQDDPHKALKDKRIIDSGCSRYMTGNKAHLANYQEFNGGSISFGGSNGRITCKGKIKAVRLDFEDVYYVEELKQYNLFYVLQMCDKKNKVVFTDTDCLVMSPDFKLPNENQVLFKIHRQHNMYSLNLKNINPSGDLACLFAEASIDESNKWHRRLGHVNFKNINKLVKRNLVRGLPSKIFENDHTCVACQKGNQNRASLENLANKSAGLKLANNSVGTQANDHQRANSEEINLHDKHFVLPIWSAYSTTAKSSGDKIEKTTDFKTYVNTNSTNLLNLVISPISTAGPLRALNDGEPLYADDPLMPHLEDIYASPIEGIFTDSSYDDEGVVTDFNNLETTMIVNQTPTTRIQTIHPKTQILGVLMSIVQTRGKVNKNFEAHALMKVRLILCKRNYCSSKFRRQEERIDCDEVFAHVAMIESIRIFLAFASYMGFIVYQMDVKSAILCGTIDEEVYVTQPPGFVDPKFPNKVYKVVKALYGLHQAHRACVKTASTLIKTQKPLVKDEEAVDVDVHLYRSMIGSLMYLTASKPDIMFAVYDCSRFQVTLKTSHLQAMKRIFRYLKGQPKLGLWYPKVSSFDLEAYSDSDYAGANLDRKSSTGEAEYVTAAHCYGQVLWIQNQLLDYGFNLMNTKIYIDNESTICIVKNPVFHSKTKHIETRHHFIRDAYKKKLIQVLKIHTDDNVANLLMKAFDVSRFKFLIVNFLNGHVIQYALMVNLTIYVSCIKPFWTTVSIKKANNVVKLRALIDGKWVIVTEDVIRQVLR